MSDETVMQDCKKCGGSGFSGQGTGYDDVCDECGGLKELPCKRCNGSGLVSISYGGDGYGDRCAAMADADEQPCPDCSEQGR